MTKNLLGTFITHNLPQQVDPWRNRRELPDKHLPTVFEFEEKLREGYKGKNPGVESER